MRIRSRKDVDSSTILIVLTVAVSVVWFVNGFHRYSARISSQILRQSSPVLQQMLLTGDYLNADLQLKTLLQLEGWKEAFLLNPVDRVIDAFPGHESIGTIRPASKCDHVFVISRSNGENLGSLCWTSDSVFVLPSFLYAPIFIMILGTLLATVVSKTAQRQIQAKLERISSDALRERTQLKQLRQSAHDLRAPLALIKAITDQCQQIPEEERNLLKSASSRLSEIAADALAGTNRRVRTWDYLAGKINHRPSAISESEFRQAMSDIQKEKSVRNPSVFTSIPLDVGEWPKQAYLDLASFERVISNLLDNGFEALNGADGQVSISTSVEKSVLEVHIRDTGVGIPPDVLERIGGAGSTFRKKGGTGLGLHFALNFVEKYSGKLEIVTEQGKGTSVRLLVPLA